MDERILLDAIPMMIVLTLINFVWAWVLTAVTPPEERQEQLLSRPAPTDWRLLRDAGPEGVRKRVVDAMTSQTKVSR